MSRRLWIILESKPDHDYTIHATSETSEDAYRKRQVFLERFPMRGFTVCELTAWLAEKQRESGVDPLSFYSKLEKQLVEASNAEHRLQ